MLGNEVEGLIHCLVRSLGVAIQVDEVAGNARDERRRETCGSVWANREPVRHWCCRIHEHQASNEVGVCLRHQEGYQPAHRIPDEDRILPVVLDGYIAPGIEVQ